MSVCRAALVLLCSVLAVTLARRSSPEQEDVQEKINSARCTSRCLSLHMTQLTVAFRHLQVSLISPEVGQPTSHALKKSKDNGRVGLHRDREIKAGIVVKQQDRQGRWKDSRGSKLDPDFGCPAVVSSLKSNHLFTVANSWTTEAIVSSCSTVERNDHVLVWCENHRRCAQCLQPCKELWETRKVHSPKSCEKQTECVTSREFLTSLRSSRQGDCPPPQKATGFAAACVESCSSDQHCPSPRKCCSNGCGHTCQAPANLYKGVPLKPRREMSFAEDSEGRVRLVWVSKFNVSIEPVVYVLQSRWNAGIHPSEDHASPWTTVAMTLSEDAILTDLRSQRWYQFKVAAINSHGSRGFTTPSKHHISSKDPSTPEHPINVRVINQTLDWMGSQPGIKLPERSRGSGVKVSVLLSWEPPGEGDLPVHNYRVTWMPRHAHTAHKHTHTLNAQTHTVHNNMHTHHSHSRTPEQSKKESNSRVTQGAQCEMWLQGLLPATSYFLSVQTVAYWGQKRLKSPRAQIVVNTISHTVAAPHYHDDQLQVKVYWKWPHHGKQKHRGPYILRWRPHTCSTNITSTDRTTTVQGTHHTITGLQFACKYRVAVSTKADRDRGPRLGYNPDLLLHQG
ncbi:hypothetical protein KUCAC02_022449 [Chaenocephalus aceratus]|uniref:Uncharacterized protein n=1 Tax=Chaenocephalus aceratus TaxID=36190 RepID=A0ACB9XP28_CHAAC|nr:hypothetical protein KUCAC02_022449 [Chaenocephalus aceratus]